MKTVNTFHPTINFDDNVRVISETLKAEFVAKYVPNIHLLPAISEVLWNNVRLQRTPIVTWGIPEVLDAIDILKAHLFNLETDLKHPLNSKSHEK